jgi:hypothetical protein
MSEDLEDELRDEVKNELEVEFDRVFGKGNTGLDDDDEFDLDASDTEMEKRLMEEYAREFSTMNDNEKL